MATLDSSPGRSASARATSLRTTRYIRGFTGVLPFPRMAAKLTRRRVLSAWSVLGGPNTTAMHPYSRSGGFRGSLNSICSRAVTMSFFWTICS